MTPLPRNIEYEYIMDTTFPTPDTTSEPYGPWMSIHRKMKAFIEFIFPSPPPPPNLSELIGSEEVKGIIDVLYDRLLREYVKMIYEEHGIRKFSLDPESEYSYGKFLGEKDPYYRRLLNEPDWWDRDDPFHVIVYDCFEDYFLKKLIPKIIADFRQDPQGIFKNPEDIKNYLALVEQNKNKPIGWDIPLCMDFYAKLKTKYQDEFQLFTMSRTVVRYFNEYAQQMYALKLKEIEHISHSGIDSSSLDIIKLNFSHLEFHKWRVDYELVKNITLNYPERFRGSKPFEFLFKHIEIAYDFFINHIYLFGGIGSLLLILWISLIIFVDKRYKVNPDFKTNFREIKEIEED